MTTITELLQPDDTVNWHEVVREWQALVAQLTSQVRAWSEARGWRVDEKTLTLTEEQLGTYEVPMLIMELAQRQVLLEPIARRVIGAQGRVDLYSYPSMDRVMLLYDGERWILRPELGPTWPLPWGESTFVDLLERFATET